MLRLFASALILIAAAEARASCPHPDQLKRWGDEAEKCAVDHHKAKDSCDPTISKPLILAQQRMMQTGSMVSPEGEVKPESCAPYTDALKGMVRAMDAYLIQCRDLRKSCLQNCEDVQKRLENSLKVCTGHQRESVEELRNRVRPSALECKSYQTVIQFSYQQLEELKEKLAKSKKCASAGSGKKSTDDSAASSDDTEDHEHADVAEQEEPPRKRTGPVKPERPGPRPQPKSPAVQKPAPVPPPAWAPTPPPPRKDVHPEDRWSFGYTREQQLPPPIPRPQQAAPAKPKTPPAAGSAEFSSTSPHLAPSWNPKLQKDGVTEPESSLWQKIKKRYIDKQPTLVDP